MNDIEVRYEGRNENYCVIVKFLQEIDKCIIPVLSHRVDIEQYARKISKYADMFNLWHQDELVGNVAVYLNAEEGFVTSFAIKPEYQKMGYGKKLWKCVCQEADERGIKKIALNVHQNNKAAKAFYMSQGFVVESESDEWIKMIYTLRD